LVLPTDHPEASNPRIDLRDFKDYPFVALDNRFQCRVQADALCAEAGFVPQIVLESDEPARLRQYVGDRRGIAILPVDLSISPRVRYVHLGSPLAVREFGVLTDARHEVLPQLQDFIAHVEAFNRRYPDWADLLDY
jgi:LysR family transcriptional activator of glutamate synthase operon